MTERRMEMSASMTACRCEICERDIAVLSSLEGWIVSRQLVACPECVKSGIECGALTEVLPETEVKS